MVTDRRLLLCLPAALAAFALAPAAQAAQVTVDYSSHTVTYTAGGGETNRLSISYDKAADTYTLSDPGAPSIATNVNGAGSGCTQTNGVAVCAAAGIGAFSIALGDYDDTLTTNAPVSVTVDGGNGADKLTTGPAADTLRGGNGGDTLIGGGGGDNYVGGNGPDTADYSAATTPVNVNPDGVANDGTDGTDNVGSDVESSIGGSAGDTLRGSPGDSVNLRGGGGDDVLYGTAQADTLDGGAGADQIFAGAGDDRLLVQDDTVDTADCGDGADTVTNDLADVLAANCENRSNGAAPTEGSGAGDAGTGAGTGDGGGIQVTAPDIRFPVRPVTFSAPGVLHVQIGCAASAADGCRGDVYVSLPSRYLVRSTATARGKIHAARGHFTAQTRRIAHRRFKIAPGKRLDAHVRVALRGHYVLRNRRKMRGKLRVVQRDTTGRVLGVTTRPVVLERKWTRRNRR